MKQATTRPIAANASRKVSTKLNISCRSACVSSVISVPVSASVSSGMAAAIRAAISSSEMPSTAATITMSSCPDAPASTCCAVVRSKSDTLAPPGESAEPNRTVPTRVSSCGPVWVSTVTASPSCRSPSSALRLSITISPGPGARPGSIISHGLSSPDW